MNKRAFSAILIEKKVVAENTYLLKFNSNKQIIPKPGQFLMLSKKNHGHFLKRPISIHYYYDDNYHFKLLVRPKGAGTKEITDIKFGEIMEFFGPLGNGFPILKNKKVALIAGGIGYAPFAFLLKELKKKNNEIDVYYGEKSEDFLVEYWRIKGVNYHIFTDNGSFGKKGNPLEYFTDNNYDNIYLCGPEIMYKVYKKRFPRLLKKSYASFERRMACGIGACKGCSIRVNDSYKYVCKDGPVFKMDEVKL